MTDAHAPTHRRYELDWIRVIAFSLLILFHTGMFFNTWDWHVKNNVTIAWLEPIMAFLHQWRMPILFFVSGAAVWFMMDKYPTGRFVWERHNRLLIPLAVGMFFIIPPQVYYERLFQGQTFDFVTFYRTVLDLVPYPKGNFSWHHLWYIPYIFTFSMVALPLFLFFKGQRGRRVLAAFQSFVAKGNRIYFLFLPVAVSEICIRPFWPDNANNLLGDWAQFTSMLIVFITGFVLAGSQAVWDSLSSLRIRSLLLASIAFGILFAFWELGPENPTVWQMSLYRVVRMLNMWLWMVVGFGFARFYLRSSNRFLRWANDAVYPFYILHQTITVIGGFYLAPLDLSVGVKFLLLAATTFGGSWILYEALIKRINLLRVCFGMRWKPPQPSTATFRDFLSFGGE